MAAWVARNKSHHLHVFLLRDGERFIAGLPFIYAMLLLSCSLVETVVSTSTLLVAIVTQYIFTRVVKNGLAMR